MKTIRIQPSDFTPFVEFNSNGKLLLEGRSIPENIYELFNPLLDFASEVAVPNIVFDVNLDYFNTATSKIMLDLLLRFDRNKMIGSVTINWHYVIDNSDSLEVAQIYSECLSRTRLNLTPHTAAIEIHKVSRPIVVFE